MSEEYDYATHEVLHMANFLAGAVDEELVEHIAIFEREEWKEKAIRARDALIELYQAIGAEHIK
jgi:hypothetical protein